MMEGTEGTEEVWDAGICGFKILDVQKLRDGGDGTDLEPGTGTYTDESPSQRLLFITYSRSGRN